MESGVPCCGLSAKMAVHSSPPPYPHANPLRRELFYTIVYNGHHSLFIIPKEQKLKDPSTDKWIHETVEYPDS